MPNPFKAIAKKQAINTTELIKRYSRSIRTACFECVNFK